MGRIPEGFRMNDPSKRFIGGCKFLSGATRVLSNSDIFVLAIIVEVGNDDKKGMLNDDLAVGRTEPLNRCACGVIPSKLDILILSGISVLCSHWRLLSVHIFDFTSF